jgi:hypothetical protein
MAKQKPDRGELSDPAPEEIAVSWPKKIWNRITWGNFSSPAFSSDYELQQMRLKTWFLRILGGFLCVSFLAGVSFLCLVGAVVIGAARSNESISNPTLHALSILAGASALAMIGSLVLLGRAAAPKSEPQPDLWASFPSALTEVLKGVAEAIKKRLTEKI